MTEQKKLLKFDNNSYVHFVTTGTYENLSYFRDTECCRVFLEELEFYRDKYNFTLLGYVIMPDHIHLLLWWDKTEKSDLSISKLMQGIKGTTARRIINLTTSARLKHPLQPGPATVPKNSKSHKRNSKYRFWRPGFYDFNIYTEEKLAEKLNYIHHNPVKAGLVSAPGDYRWSSYKLYFGTSTLGESISSPYIALGADAPRYPGGADAPRHARFQRFLEMVR